MARVELAPEVDADLERILEHLAPHQAADAPARIREIIEGISVLEHHPLMGRPAPEDLRELIIGATPGATWPYTASWPISTLCSCSRYAVSGRRVTSIRKRLQSLTGTS